MKQLAILFSLFLTLSFLGSCANLGLDKVLPDKRTKYSKSRSMEDLEIPPDLTLDTSDDATLIPGEEPNTLSGYQQMQGLGVADVSAGDGELIRLRGSLQEVWETVSQYWTESEYELEIEDQELGVMETAWLTEGDEVGSTRHRFSVFIEPSAQPGIVTMLFDGTTQSRTDTGWEEVETDEELTLRMRKGLRQALTGATDTPVASPEASLRLVTRCN